MASVTVRRQEHVYVGEVLHRAPRHAALRARLASLGAVCVALAVALATPEELSPIVGVPTLALTAGLILVRPSARDGVIGRFGLRRGWRVHTLAELAEWRLGGEHLRFRVDARWFALSLPAATQPLIERELEQHAAGKRSPFS